MPVMPVTKQDERQALTKIRELVAALGPDSYIGTAFRGVFEIAERNIDDDAALNPVDEAAHFQKAADEYGRQAEAANKRADAAEKQAREQAAYAARLADDLGAMREHYDDLLVRFRAQETRALGAEAEIVRLKAKLYDLLTANTPA
jgi:hypothetical protein